MIYYVQKPVVFEAIQYKNLLASKYELLRFCGLENITIISYLLSGDYDVFVKTSQGKVKLDENDYIIKIDKNEFQVCKPEEFKNMYKVIGEKPDIYKILCI